MSSEYETIKIWNYESGECIRTLRGHSDCVRDIKWIMNTEYIVSASDDRTLKIWNY